MKYELTTDEKLIEYIGKGYSEIHWKIEESDPMSIGHITHLDTFERTATIQDNVMQCKHIIYFDALLIPINKEDDEIQDEDEDPFAVG